MVASRDLFGAAKMKSRAKLILRLRVSIATGLVLGVLTLPTQNAAAQFTEKKVLTLAAAKKMVAAAQAEADRQHLAGVIAVADDGGWPILVVRMDNAAYVASVELAPGKARTAALFRKPSQALEDAINHGRIAAVTAHGYIEMQGGRPIVVDGQVIGGIGASFDPRRRGRVDGNARGPECCLEFGRSDRDRQRVRHLPHAPLSWRRVRYRHSCRGVR